MLFENLPESFVGELWSVWLDSALCSSQLRKCFLNNMASSFCLLRNPIKVFSSHSVSWYITRQLKASTLEVAANTERRLLTLCLRKMEKNIRAVIYNGAFKSGIIDTFALYCRNLTSFSFLRSPASESFTEILWFNSQLLELRLRNVLGLNASHFEDIHLVRLRLLSVMNINCRGGLLVASMCNSKSLTHVDFDSGVGEGVNEVFVSSVLDSCRLVRCFGLGALDLSDGALSTLATTCTRIAHLDLTYNQAVTDEGMLELAQQLKHLESIAIAMCTQLTGQSLVHLAEHSADTIEQVRMNKLRSVHRNVFVQFLQKCTKLRTISTNLRLDALVVPSMVRIQTLVLHSVVDDDTLCCIATHCTSLQALSITNYLFSDEKPDALLIKPVGASDTSTPTEVVPCTEKGLLALAHGLSQLRLLRVRELATGNTLSSLAVSLWRELRPRLRVVSTGTPFEYDALTQE